MNRSLKPFFFAITAIAFSSLLLWLHRQNRQLVRELVAAREQVAKIEAASVNSQPTAATVEGAAERTEDMQSEILRLRGEVGRAGRAEAEVSRLRKELEEVRLRGGNAEGQLASGSDLFATYLGSPVIVPANLDPAYAKEGLSSAIQMAAQKAGISLKKLIFDESEFPFVAGVVSEPGDWDKLKAQFQALEGYNFSGSVGDDTRHTFSLTPPRVYPPEAGQQIHRRMTLRMELFHDRLVQGDN